MITLVFPFFPLTLQVLSNYFLFVLYFSVNAFISLRCLVLNRDGINSHKRLEKYLSIQRVKGGADKNRTEKFNGKCCWR